MSFRKIALETLNHTRFLLHGDAKKFDYYDEDSLAGLACKDGKNTIRFMKSTTTAAISNIEDPCVVLNFASAKRPGGGFLSTAIAQEEDLCRKTSLYHSISKCEEFYDGVKDTLYTDRIIYSPFVFLVRDEEFNFIDPLSCAAITCAAPNNASKHPENVLKEIFERRIGNVLKVAQDKGQETIVLGAWGCGAFKNDPKIVAEAFKKVIPRYKFETIVFAIPDDKNLDVFKSILS